MNKLGIWLGEREFHCNVNEDTTCYEIIQQLVQPAGLKNENQHSFENINACEYKLDVGLFIKKTNNANEYDNIVSNVTMEQKERRQGQTSLSLCYETRLQELSEWIGLIDSAIEIYDNSDIEDGLSEEEIIDNQVTRLGLLLKKQSSKLDNLLKKQQERSLYQARVLQETLVNELEDGYGKINYLDRKVKEINSRLSLQKRLLSLELSEECLLDSSESVNFRSQSGEITESSIPSETAHNGLITEIKYPQPQQENDHHYLQVHTNSSTKLVSSSVDKWKAIKQCDDRTTNICNSERLVNGSGFLASYIGILSNDEEEISRKQWLNQTFGLADEDTSVLV